VYPATRAVADELVLVLSEAVILIVIEPAEQGARHRASSFPRRSRDAKSFHGTRRVIVDKLESCRIRLRSRTATTATSNHDDRLNEPSEYPGKQKAKPDWLRFAAIVGSLSG
jgi:hypothetical protein